MHSLSNEYNKLKRIDIFLMKKKKTRDNAMRVLKELAKCVYLQILEGENLKKAQILNQLSISIAHLLYISKLWW